MKYNLRKRLFLLTALSAFALTAQAQHTILSPGPQRNFYPLQHYGEVFNLPPPAQIMTVDTPAAKGLMDGAEGKTCSVIIYPDSNYQGKGICLSDGQINVYSAPNTQGMRDALALFRRPIGSIWLQEGKAVQLKINSAPDLVLTDSQKDLDLRYTTPANVSVAPCSIQLFGDTDFKGPNTDCLAPGRSVKISGYFRSSNLPIVSARLNIFGSVIRLKSATGDVAAIMNVDAEGINEVKPGRFVSEVNDIRPFNDATTLINDNSGGFPALSEFLAAGKTEAASKKSLLSDTSRYSSQKDSYGGHPGQYEPSPKGVVWVFGDSLSATKSVIVFYKIIPDPGYGYWAGRFTNGYNWTDYITSTLSPPFDANRLKNYAVGGSEIYSNLWFRPSAYKVIHNVIDNISSEDTVVLWSGSNNFLNHTDHASDQRSPGSFAHVTASELKQTLALLTSKGVKNIIIPNVPDFADIPWALYQKGGATGSLVTSISNEIKVYNEDITGYVDSLRAETSQTQMGAHIVVYDLAKYVKNWKIGAYTSYAMTDVTASCVDNGGLAFFHNNSDYKDKPCPDKMFFDYVHPTSLAQCGLAFELADAVIRGNFLLPTADADKAESDLSKCASLRQTPTRPVLPSPPPSTDPTDVSGVDNPL